MDYAVPLFFVGLVATALGQWGTEYFIRKVRASGLLSVAGAILSRR